MWSEKEPDKPGHYWIYPPGCTPNAGRLYEDGQWNWIGKPRGRDWVWEPGTLFAKATPPSVDVRHQRAVGEDREHLDEVVGHGPFHLEDMGDGEWFLVLGGVRLRVEGRVVLEDEETPMVTSEKEYLKHE